MPSRHYGGIAVLVMDGCAAPETSACPDVHFLHAADPHCHKVVAHQVTCLHYVCIILARQHAVDWDHTDIRLPALPPPQVSTQLLSIRAVLQCLQAMIVVPLAEELVLGGAPQPSDYLPAGVVTEVGTCVSVGQLASAEFNSSLMQSLDICKPAEPM
jgi:hypothetical protein